MVKKKDKNSKQTMIREKHIIYSCILIALICSIVLIYLFALQTKNSHTGRLVTFHDRGQEKVILTNARTIKDALRDAHIAIDPKDIVEPSLDSNLNKSDSAVIIYRAKMVLIADGAERQRILTAAQSPNEMAVTAGLSTVDQKDKTAFSKGNFLRDGANTILTITRKKPDPEPVKVAFGPGPRALTRSKGAQLYTDATGVAHRETYYDLPMNIVISACGPGGYTIRSDGAKIDKDGYVLVAANYGVYPRCTVVETSMGPGKVYDTGGFALRYPHGFDLATDWTNFDGR